MYMKENVSTKGHASKYLLENKSHSTENLTTNLKLVQINYYEQNERGHTISV